MSVEKSKQKETKVAYVYHAGRLLLESGTLCARLPKRLSFTVVQYIMNAANDIFAHAVKANSIRVTSSVSAEQRLWHLREAVGAVAWLEALLVPLSESELRKRKQDAFAEEMGETPSKVARHTATGSMGGITEGQLVQWQRHCEHEKRLLMGMVSHDQKAYAHLLSIVNESEVAEVMRHATASADSVQNLVFPHTVKEEEPPLTLF